ncbi:MAG: isoleucine--tRNA ligase [Bacteroidales bacterium]|nr:isoleucine--tRNA ligase [Bacteroidales bacterium]
MAKKFIERSQFDLAAINKEVLAEWDKSNMFERSLSERADCPAFVFYEGPPSANGHPGIHHVMARSIKDVFCRYKTMKGFRVDRKAGWDTHGLPVELGVEKEMGITKEDIGRTVSVEDYNNRCRTNVMKYTEEWRDLSHKMGYWVDMDNPYITYENSYIETLWWLLGQLYKKGLLYKGYTIQPYSPAAGTGLSSHELNQPGTYRDVKDTTITAQFKLVNPPTELTAWGEAYLLAWTTTPWTLPSNTALCVGPNIDYVAVQTFNAYTGAPITVVIAEARISAYFNEAGKDIDFESYKSGDKIIPYRIVARYKGTDLKDIAYEQLLPFVNPGEGAFRVILGDYVTTEDGTGIVHIAPTFGADDAFVAKQAGVPPLQLVTKKGELRPMVDLQGRYYPIEELDETFVANQVNREAYAPYAGRYVKNDYDQTLTEKDETLDVSICIALKAAGLAFRIEKYVHNYPHCWRTDKPLLYYPLDSWFIRSTACKERMQELNQGIYWKPESTGTGRFGKWLENLNDWNLSRSRYWGTPLPIWRNEDGEELCISSLEELYNAIDRSVAAGYMLSNPLRDKGFVPGDYSKANYDKIDLHRPYVDEIILVSATGKPMHRESDLIDVWFDSGAMPYAQLHYPFENKELFDKGGVFPADFIAEGVDQTRGWFFTLHALGTMVFDNVAFKAVVSNGLVLDKNGNKMSKRLGNAVDPFVTIDKYGSDPLRWYMLTNASPWDNLKFDEEGIKEVSRGFFGKLFQTYSFLTMYANVDGFTYAEEDIALADRPVIDRWVLSLLNTLVKKVDECYADYEPTKAGRLIEDFVINNLSNWFVRLSRKRFWGSGLDTDKISAYQVLYTCLETVAKLIAPIAPFYADRLYTDLIAATSRDTTQSVHLASFPKANEAYIDAELEYRMALAQSITSMVLSIRKQEHIIVRQPLQTLSIPVVDAKQREAITLVRDLILEEVNVKSLNFIEGSSLEKKVKCNFRIMGKKFGKQMKAVSHAVEQMTQAEIATLEQAQSVILTHENESYTIELADVEIITEGIPGWKVVSDGKVTVALDLEITDDLRREGLAREFIKRVQTYRKESGFEITDRIRIVVSTHPLLNEMLAQFAPYICTQVLADGIETGEVKESVTFDFDTFSIQVNITVV